MNRRSEDDAETARDGDAAPSGSRAAEGSSDDDTRQFVEITNVNTETARFYLDMSDGDVMSAVAQYYAGGAEEADRNFVTEREGPIQPLMRPLRDMTAAIEELASDASKRTEEDVMMPLLSDTQDSLSSPLIAPRNRTETPPIPISVDAPSGTKEEKRLRDVSWLTRLERRAFVRGRKDRSNRCSKSTATTPEQVSAMESGLTPPSKLSRVISRVGASWDRLADDARRSRKDNPSSSLSSLSNPEKRHRHVSRIQRLFADVASFAKIDRSFVLSSLLNMRSEVRDIVHRNKLSAASLPFPVRSPQRKQKTTRDSLLAVVTAVARDFDASSLDALRESQTHAFGFLLYTSDGLDVLPELISTLGAKVRAESSPFKSDASEILSNLLRAVLRWRKDCSPLGDASSWRGEVFSDANDDDYNDDVDHQRRPRFRRRKTKAMSAVRSVANVAILPTSMAVGDTKEAPERFVESSANARKRKRPGLSSVGAPEDSSSKFSRRHRRENSRRRTPDEPLAAMILELSTCMRRHFLEPNVERTFPTVLSRFLVVAILAYTLPRATNRGRPDAKTICEELATDISTSVFRDVFGVASRVRSTLLDLAHASLRWRGASQISTSERSHYRRLLCAVGLLSGSVVACGLRSSCGHLFETPSSPWRATGKRREDRKPTVKQKKAASLILRPPLVPQPIAPTGMTRATTSTFLRDFLSGKSPLEVWLRDVVYEKRSFRKWGGHFALDLRRSIAAALMVRLDLISIGSAHDSLLRSNEIDDDVVASYMPNEALVEVWRSALSIVRDLRKKIQIRKRRQFDEGNADAAISSSSLSQSGVERAIERANYLRRMIETSCAVSRRTQDDDANTNVITSNTLGRLRCKPRKSKQKQTKFSKSRSMADEYREDIVRSVRNFIISEDPSLDTVDDVRSENLLRCIRRHDALAFALAHLNIGATDDGAPSVLISSRAISLLEPMLWQLHAALANLSTSPTTTHHHMRRQPLTPDILSGTIGVPLNTAASLVAIWGELQTRIASFLSDLPMPSAPPPTPMTPPRASSRRRSSSSSSATRTTSPMPPLFLDENENVARTSRKTSSRVVSFRQSEDVVGSAALATKDETVVDEFELDSTLEVEKSSIRRYSVALFGTLRLGGDTAYNASFLRTSGIMHTLTAFLPRASSGTTPKLVARASSSSSSRGSFELWESVTPLQRLVMSTMRTLILQLSEAASNDALGDPIVHVERGERERVDVPRNLTDVVFADICEMAGVMAESHASADDARDPNAADEQNEIFQGLAMASAEARAHALELLRLLYPVHSSAIVSAALRPSNVRALCCLFRFGDGKLQRRVSDFLLSVASEDTDSDISKRARKQVAETMWECLELHTSDTCPFPRTAESANGIVRLTCRICQHLIANDLRSVRVASLTKPGDGRVNHDAQKSREGQWGTLVDVDVQRRLARVSFSNDDDDDENEETLTLAPASLTAVLPVDTLVHLSGGRSTLSSLPSKKDAAFAWEHCVNGSWERLSASDSARLESAMMRKLPVVELESEDGSSTVRRVADLSRYVLISSESVNLNDKFDGDSDLIVNNACDLCEDASDTLFGIAALRAGPFVSRQVLASRIRRCGNDADSSVFTRRRCRHRREQYLCPPLLEECDAASRRTIIASESVRALRLLLRHEEENCGLLADEVLRRLRTGLVSLRALRQHLRDDDDAIRKFVSSRSFIEASSACLVLGGFIEPVRVGGEVQKRGSNPNLADRATLVDTSDEDTMYVRRQPGATERLDRTASLIWQSSPSTIDTKVRLIELEGVGRQVPRHIIRLALSDLLELAGELVALPIRVLPNIESTQLSLAMWRRSTLGALRIAALDPELVPNIQTQVHANPSVIESLASYAATFAAIPVVASDGYDVRAMGRLEMMCSLKRVQLRRHRLLRSKTDDASSVSPPPTVSASKDEGATSVKTVREATYDRIAASLSERLGLPVDFCILAIERCGGNANAAADFAFSNLEHAETMVEERRVRLESEAKKREKILKERDDSKKRRRERLKKSESSRRDRARRILDIYIRGGNAAMEHMSHDHGEDLPPSVFQMDRELKCRRNSAHTLRCESYANYHRSMKQGMYDAVTPLAASRCWSPAIGAKFDEDRNGTSLPPMRDQCEYLFVDAGSQPEAGVLSLLEQNLATSYARQLLRVVLSTSSESIREVADGVDNLTWAQPLLHALLYPVVHSSNDGDDVWTATRTILRGFVRTISLFSQDSHAVFRMLLDHAATLLRVAVSSVDEFVLRNWYGSVPRQVCRTDAAMFHEPSVPLAACIVDFVLDVSPRDVGTHDSILQMIGFCVGALTFRGDTFDASGRNVFDPMTSVCRRRNGSLRCVGLRLLNRLVSEGVDVPIRVELGGKETATSDIYTSLSKTRRSDEVDFVSRAAVGDHFDVQDGENYGARWCVARVIEVLYADDGNTKEVSDVAASKSIEQKRRPTALRLHFEGWDARYDETISLRTSPSRVAPLDSRTKGGYTGGKGAKSINIFISASYMVRRLLNFIRHVCTQPAAQAVIRVLSGEEIDTNEDAKLRAAVDAAVKSHHGRFTTLIDLVEDTVGLSRGTFFSQTLRVRLVDIQKRAILSLSDDNAGSRICLSRSGVDLDVLRYQHAVSVRCTELRDISRLNRCPASRSESSDASSRIMRRVFLSSRRKGRLISTQSSYLSAGCLSSRCTRAEFEFLLNADAHCTSLTLCSQRRRRRSARFGVGARVEVRRGSMWTGAWVIASSPRVFDVRYDDGTVELRVANDRVLDEGREDVMRGLVGCRVAVAFTAGWYEGTIASFDTTCVGGKRFSYLIKYDDGDERRHVFRNGRRILFHILSSSVDERRRLVGTRIEMHKESGLYRGIVTGFDDATGLSEVSFDDGNVYAYDLSQSSSVAIAAVARGAENNVSIDRLSIVCPPFRILPAPWPHSAPATDSSRDSVVTAASNAVARAPAAASTPTTLSSTTESANDSGNSNLVELALAERYQTQVATLLSLGFDVTVSECMQALVTSMGNMEHAVGILLERQAERQSERIASSSVLSGSSMTNAIRASEAAAEGEEDILENADESTDEEKNNTDDNDDDNEEEEEEEEEEASSSMHQTLVMRRLSLRRPPANASNLIFDTLHHEHGENETSAVENDEREAKLSGPSIVNVRELDDGGLFGDVEDSRLRLVLRDILSIDTNSRNASKCAQTCRSLRDHLRAFSCRESFLLSRDTAKLVNLMDPLRSWLFVRREHDARPSTKGTKNSKTMQRRGVGHRQRRGNYRQRRQRQSSRRQKKKPARTNSSRKLRAMDLRSRSDTIVSIMDSFRRAVSTSSSDAVLSFLSKTKIVDKVLLSRSCRGWSGNLRKAISRAASALIDSVARRLMLVDNISGDVTSVLDEIARHTLEHLVVFEDNEVRRRGCALIASFLEFSPKYAHDFFGATTRQWTACTRALAAAGTTSRDFVTRVSVALSLRILVETREATNEEGVHVDVVRALHALEDLQDADAALRVLGIDPMPREMSCVRGAHCSRQIDVTGPGRSILEISPKDDATSDQHRHRRRRRRDRRNVDSGAGYKGSVTKTRSTGGALLGNAPMHRGSHFWEIRVDKIMRGQGVLMIGVVSAPLVPGLDGTRRKFVSDFRALDMNAIGRNNATMHCMTSLRTATRIGHAPTSRKMGNSVDIDTVARRQGGVDTDGGDRPSMLSSSSFAAVEGSGGTTTEERVYGSFLSAGDRVGVRLIVDQHGTAELHFWCNGRALGRAFAGIRMPVWPCVVMALPPSLPRGNGVSFFGRCGRLFGLSTDLSDGARGAKASPIRICVLPTHVSTYTYLDRRAGVALRRRGSCSLLDRDDRMTSALTAARHIVASPSSSSISDRNLPDDFLRRAHRRWQQWRTQRQTQRHLGEGTNHVASCRADPVAWLWLAGFAIIRTPYGLGIYEQQGIGAQFTGKSCRRACSCTALAKGSSDREPCISFGADTTHTTKIHLLSFEACLYASSRDMNEWQQGSRVCAYLDRNGYDVGLIRVSELRRAFDVVKARCGERINQGLIWRGATLRVRGDGRRARALGVMRDGRVLVWEAAKYESSAVVRPHTETQSGIDEEKKAEEEEDGEEEKKDANTTSFIESNLSSTSHENPTTMRADSDEDEDSIGSHAARVAVCTRGVLVFDRAASKREKRRDAFIESFALPAASLDMSYERFARVVRQCSDDLWQKSRARAEIAASTHGLQTASDVAAYDFFRARPSSSSLTASDDDEILGRLFACILEISETFQTILEFMPFDSASCLRHVKTKMAETPLDVFVASRGLLMLNDVKRDLFVRNLMMTQIRVTPGEDEYATPTDLQTVTLNRKRAADLRSRSYASVSKAVQLRDSLFGQLLRHWRGQSTDVLRRQWSSAHNPQSRCVVFKFLGEGVVDLGGPFRAVISDVVAEVVGGLAGLFVNTETDDESPCRFAPDGDRVLLTFFGQLIGVAIRCGVQLAIAFPRMFWMMCVGDCIDDDVLREDPSILKEVDDRAYDIFTGNAEGDIHCGHALDAERSRLHKIRGAMRALLNGIQSVVPLQRSARVFMWHDFRDIVCGCSRVDIDALQRHAQYEAPLTSASPVVSYLWTALSKFTNSQRVRFLEFVFARKRLPRDLDTLEMPFRVQLCKSDGAIENPDAYYPNAQTCFFTLKLPAYSSAEICYERLRYASETCVSMDADVRLNDSELWGA